VDTAVGGLSSLWRNVKKTWELANRGDKSLREVIFRLLDSDEHLVDFLFDQGTPRLRKRAGILKEDAWCFSDGEQILIRAALEFWSGSGHVYLWELLEGLDNENLKRVLKAIAEVREIRDVIKTD
jgi:hypothetical protein